MKEIGAVTEVVGRAQKGKDLWYAIQKSPNPHAHTHPSP
jgi:hypothetical protein